MRNTLKKSFAVLLVVFMLLGSIPFASFAKTTAVTNEAELQGALAGASAGDVIDVTANITLTSAITVNGNVTVKSSNGSSILRAGNYKSYMFVVANGGTLTLEGITINGNRTSAQTADLATEMIVVQAGGTLNFNDGTTLTTNRANAAVSGGGISVAGTMNMNGGKIVAIHMHNTNSVTTMYGAAITVTGGTVNMNGGTIGGSAIGSAEQNDGRNGAVSVLSGTFNMYGGAISGNLANEQGGGAGGAFIAAGATFNLIGGSVINNSNRRNGGAFRNEGNLNISGGIVSGNTATYTDIKEDPTLFYGGAVLNYGTLNISGGEISGNVAKSCGGAIYNYGAMTVSGGKISGNRCDRYSAGAIFVDGTGTCNISGGEISGNAAGQFGGALAVTSTASNALVITAGAFSNNTCGATNCGSDIYITTANSSNVAINCIGNCRTYKLYVDNMGARYSASNAVAATSSALTAGNGYVYVDSGDGHIFGEWTVTAAATCTAAGTSQRVCINCGKTETRTDAALGHSYDSGVETKAATCTAAGSKLFTCSRCHTTKTEAIPALGHKLDAGVQTKAPSCTTTGTKKFSCTRCTYTETKTVPALGHNPGAATTVAATCTEAGSKSYTCTRCSQKITETIAPLGHDGKTVTTAATCTVNGSKVTTCTRCKTVLETVVLYAPGHVESDWIVTAKPTKTKTGLQIIKCTVCMETLRSEVIPMIPDPTVSVAKVEADPAEAGVKVPVSLIGNEGVWSMGFYVCYSNELSLKGVLAGDIFETVEASKYDVNPASDSRAAAAFAAAGVSTSGMKCYRFYAENYLFENLGNDGTLCTLVFNLPTNSATFDFPITIIPVSGLTINANADDVALLTSAGSIFVPDLDTCPHEAGEWQITKAAACLTAGSRCNYCIHCGRLMTTEVVAALGHDYNEGVITTQPTCTAPGQKTVTCQRCTATTFETVPATGHTAGEWEVVEEAHGAVEGLKVKKCTVCKTVIASEVIPAPFAPALVCSTEETEGNTSVTANITFNNNPGVWSMVLYIYYDEALTLTDVSNGVLFDKSCLTVGAFGKDPDFRAASVTAFNECGVDMTGKKVCCIFFEGDDLDVDINGDGVLAKVTFTAPDVLEGTYEYGIVNRATDIYDCTEASFKVAKSSGEIRVLENVCDHAWGAWQETTPATCTEDGLKTRTCPLCTKSETEVIKALGHNVPDVKKVDPSCTTTGSEGGICTRCHETIATTIPALGHDWSDWTPVDDTHMSRECARCHETDTMEIALDPTFSVLGGAAQTESTITVPVYMTGNPGVWAAKIYVYYDPALVLTNVANGELFSKSELTLGSLNIKASENSSAKKAFAACGVDTANWNAVCLYYESDDIDVQMEKSGVLANLTFDTPAEEGTYFIGVLDSPNDVYNVEENNVEFLFQNGEIEITEAPPCDHVAGEPVTVAPTCTEAGSITTRCIICNKVISSTEIKALGHTAGTWEVIKEATATTAGTKAIKCTVCHTVLKEKEILPIGTPAITVGDASAVVNNEFSVPVYISNNPGVWGLQVYFTYDSALTLKSIEAGDVFSSSELTLGTLNIDPNSNSMSRKAFTETGVSMDGVKTNNMYFEYDETEDNNSKSGLLFTATFEGVAEAGDYDVFIVMRPKDSFNWDDELVSFVLEDNTAYITEVPPCEHVAGEPEVVKATCTTAGYTKVVCTKCTAVLSYVAEAALGHDYVTLSETAATCTTAGSKVCKCSRCQSEDTIVIPAKGHKPGEWTAIDEDYEARICSVCHNEVERRAIVKEPAIRVGDKTALVGESVKVPVIMQNNPGFWGLRIYVYYDKAVVATSLDNGVLASNNELTKGTLNKDAATFANAVKAFDACGVSAEGKNVTCVYYEADDLENDILGSGDLCYFTFTAPETAGEYEIGIVARGSDMYNCEEIDVPFTLLSGTLTVTDAPECAHEWGDGVVTTEPSCTTPGVRTYTCSVCTETKTEAIKALGHDTETITTEAKCEVDGSIVVKCKRCKEVISSTPIKATGHDWGDGVVTTKPTCTEKGVKTYTCSVCTKTRTEDIAPNGHIFSDKWTIDVQPTATKPGSKSRHCLYCDAKTDVTEIPVPDIYLGDVNGDGVVNSKDIRLMNQYLADMSKEVEIVFVNSDINNDGKVNSKDSRILQTYLKKNITYVELLEYHDN